MQRLMYIRYEVGIRGIGYASDVSLAKANTSRLNLWDFVFVHFNCAINVDFRTVIRLLLRLSRDSDSD